MGADGEMVKGAWSLPGSRGELGGAQAQGCYALDRFSSGSIIWTQKFRVFWGFQNHRLTFSSGPENTASSFSIVISTSKRWGLVSWACPGVIISNVRNMGLEFGPTAL